MAVPGALHAGPSLASGTWEKRGDAKTASEAPRQNHGWTKKNPSTIPCTGIMRTAKPSTTMPSPQHHHRPLPSAKIPPPATWKQLPGPSCAPQQRRADTETRDEENTPAADAGEKNSKNAAPMIPSRPRTPPAPHNPEPRLVPAPVPAPAPAFAPSAPRRPPACAHRARICSCWPRI